jgi:hypothetical protein
MYISGKEGLPNHLLRYSDSERETFSHDRLHSSAHPNIEIGILLSDDCSTSIEHAGNKKTF